MIVSVAGIISVLTVLSEQQVTDATLLLPLVLIAVATTSYLSARRSDAQRTLLAKQALLLSRVLERTRRQEQEVTEVLDAVDFGVIRISADGKVSVTNEAHARLQQAIRTDDEDADAPAFRDDGVTRLPDAELPLERALRGEAFDAQVVWFGQEPRPRQALSISARRLFDSAGRDAGAVVISRDVTTELEALRARDELVASVSHELRTPLTSILGYLDLAIEEPDLPDQVRSKLDVAERNAERLLGLVGDILAASSSSSSSVEATIDPQDIDARDIVRASVEALLPRARRASDRRSTPPGSKRRPCGPIRCGCDRSSTTCCRTRSTTTATPARSSSARRPTAPRAGSWCATRAWGSATRIACGCSSATSRRAHRAARAPGSASPSRATSSARTAAISACTARSGSARPSS